MKKLLWWWDDQAWLPWWMRRCHCRSYHLRTGLHAQTCPRDHPKALEVNLEVAESATKDWCSIADNLEKRLDLVEQQRDDLKAKLEAAERACAEMREALSRASDELDGDGSHQPQTCGILGQPLCYIHKALSSTFGTVYEAFQKENEQLKKAVGEALETLEAFSRSNSWGERLMLEPSIDRLSALVKQP